MSVQSHTSVHSQRSQHKRKRALRPHKRKRAFQTSKHSILQTGYKLSGATNKTEYRIDKCIGKGRFSHVYSAFDESQHRHVAVKVATNPKAKELLHQEYNIMLKFEGSPYICKVFDFEVLPKEIGIGNFLCMELCDEQNLSDKRKECPTKCFGVQKGALIGVEMMLSLREFHRKGFVHRDIKPSNFVLPQSKCWRHHLYIVDFGLSKPWNYATDGVVEQGEAKFIGTSLYASISAHKEWDLSPIDDLWSALFVIIDISTNALPWKEKYILLEKDPKHRRATMGKLKQQFIDYMLSNEGRHTTTTVTSDGDGVQLFNDFKSLFPFQFPKEYRELFRNVSSTKYGQQPKYDELIKILRTLASNGEYTDSQYMADHAPRPVARPIHSNFDSLQMETHVLCKAHILGQCEVMENAIDQNDLIGSTQCTPSCPHGLHPTVNLEYSHHSQHNQRRTLHAPLCREYILNGKCNSYRPRGSWCNGGYHWTLNDELHYRNHGELPLVFVGTDSLCNDALESMECREYSEQNKTCPQGLHHPKKGMQWVWNENNTFSARKPCWGQLDVEEFKRWGLYPKGVDYTKSEVTTSNFKSKLNPYVLNRFSALLEELVFEEEDFEDEQVLEQWSKLNVSQSIAFLKRLQNVQSPQSMNDENVRKNQLMETLKNAVNLGNNGNDRNIEDSMYRRPSQCSPYPSKQHEHHLRRKAIRYPALYQKTIEKGSTFTMKVKDSRYHSSNGPSERASILQRLEEFARHSRTKPFGADVVPLLMEIPAKYAIAVLDELQQMGLRKIAVVQSAIKRACNKKKPLITKETQQRKMNSDHNIHHHHQRKSVSDSMYHNPSQHHHPHRVPRRRSARLQVNERINQSSSGIAHMIDLADSDSEEETPGDRKMEDDDITIGDVEETFDVYTENEEQSLNPHHEESMNYAMTRTSKPEVTLVCYWVMPKQHGHKQFVASIHSKDHSKTAGEEYLNDTIIDFQLHYIYASWPCTFKEEVYIFNSFFWKKLVKLRSNKATANDKKQILKWTRRYTALFDKKYLIIPKCEKQHWELIIICHAGKVLKEWMGYFKEHREKKKKLKNKEKEEEEEHGSDDKDVESEEKYDDEVDVARSCITILDSLNGKGKSSDFALIRKWLNLQAQQWIENTMKNEKMENDCDDDEDGEYNIYDAQTITGRIAKVPEQPNGHDCGCFLLRNALQFGMDGGFEDTVNKKRFNLSTWYDPIHDGVAYRTEIASVIGRLVEEQKPVLLKLQNGVGSGKQRIKTPGLESSKMEEDDEEPLIVNKRKRRNLKQRRAIDDSSDEESAKEEVDESPPITPTKMELDDENERNIVGDLSNIGIGIRSGPVSAPPNCDRDSEIDVPIGHQEQLRLPMNRKRKRDGISCSSGERLSKRRKHKNEDSSSEDGSEDELKFGSVVGESYVNKTRTRRQTKEVSYADPKSDTQLGKEFKEVADRVTAIDPPPPDTLAVANATRSGTEQNLPLFPSLPPLQLPLGPPQNLNLPLFPSLPPLQLPLGPPQNLNLPLFPSLPPFASLGQSTSFGMQYLSSIANPPIPFQSQSQSVPTLPLSSGRDITADKNFKLMMPIYSIVIDMASGHSVNGDSVIVDGSLATRKINNWLNKQKKKKKKRELPEGSGSALWKVLTMDFAEIQIGEKEIGKKKKKTTNKHGQRHGGGHKAPLNLRMRSICSIIREEKDHENLITFINATKNSIDYFSYETNHPHGSTVFLKNHLHL